MPAAFGMHLRLTARPGRVEALLEALLAVDAVLRDEPGCRFHVVGVVPGEGRSVVVSEAWTDRAAHARWREEPATEALIARVRAAAEGPPDVVEVDWRGGKGLPET